MSEIDVNNIRESLMSHNNDVSEYPDYDDELQVMEEMEQYTGYGTPESPTLKDLNSKGLFPIGITTMMCEETFIFRGKKEAEEGAKYHMPDGWWYDLAGFWIDWDAYHKEMGRHQGEETDDLIYWLNDSYKPKR